MLENVWAAKDGQMIMLALDWAKAFDSISPEALLAALRRFGLPGQVLEMIGAIYSDRNFFVKDAESCSSKHPQHHGISQGCPLSPFLFVMMMTALMHDAKGHLLTQHGAQLSKDIVAHDILYADDTLIVDVDCKVVEQFMHSIGEAGAVYGLVFNWSKLEALPVRCAAQICKPDGSFVKSKTSMLYLGSLLASDGRIGSELGRRIGMAETDFRTLSKVWSHAALSKPRKLQIYLACVVSKLMYCLYTAWLSTAERRRLDAFHVRCIRRIMKIPSSYISRVPNKTVLANASVGPLSMSLLEQQLLYLGKLAARPSDDILRSTVLKPGTVQLRDNNKILRGRGRPRITWATAVYSEAVRVAGSQQHLDESLQQINWAAMVKRHCKESEQA